MRQPVSREAPFHPAEAHDGASCQTTAAAGSCAVRADRWPQPDRRRIGELLAGTAAGDTDAFAALYDTLIPHVWPLISAVTGDHQQAQAATQLAFENMWKSAPSCPRDPDAATAWAMAIAMRSASPGGEDDLPDPRPHADPRAQSRRHRVLRVLFMLSAQQRASILLAHCGRLTVDQVAQALDISRGAAATLLRDGLLDLRNLLEGVTGAAAGGDRQ